MKYALVTAVMLFTAAGSFAQKSEAPDKEKRYTQQVGVQINELFRQVFNFGGNNTSAVTNPYLFMYSINSTRTGWGLRTGIGYNYQSLTNDDAITQRSTDLNDLQARIGGEKRFSLSPKWTAGAGLDAVLNYNDDYTKSVIRSFDTVTTTTKSQITSYGGGPMLWLRYHLTSKVLIGTESSFYYGVGQEKNDISITQRRFNGNGSGQLETTSSKVDNKRVEGKLSMPVAFFLIVKF